ncbi:MAG: tetratricopeptide repeat protein [Gammaproteobacteria bacterium]|nr:tetratricopeptide repeat protein [Gammaproteobacteria bacterium]
MSATFFTTANRCVLLLVLGCLPAVVTADALSQLPEQWSERLEPIAEADLSGAESNARQAILETRAELARLLPDSSTHSQELAEGYGRLGALSQVYGLDSAAKSGFRNAMMLAPESFRWVYYAAYQASHSGQHEEATLLLQQAERLNPDYRAVALRLGESWLELNRIEAAVAALQRAANDPGLRARALYHLAQIDLLQRRYDEAIDKLQEVLRIDPAADQAHYPLARAWRAKGDLERAQQHMARRGKQLPVAADPMIDELLGVNQGARRYFGQGLKASHEQRFADAAAAFRQGLEIAPENNQARVSLARALYLSGEPEQALQQLQQVLSKNPEQHLARFLAAVLFAERGELRASSEQFAAVLRQEPEHYGAHFCLANLFFSMAEFGQAEAHYREALRANPDIPPARWYRLLAAKHAGALDENLIGSLERESAAHPEQTMLRYLLIRMLVLSDAPQVRDPERARGLVNDLVAQMFIPPHVELQALVAAAIGNFEQAVELQQQLLPTLVWMGDDLYERAQTRLTAYRRGEMPAGVWYQEASMLPSPKIDAVMLFREYPSPVPY